MKGRWILLFCSIILQITLSKKYPNIVFIVIDDLGWADVGYRYYSDYKLQTIDNLRAEGVDLTNYYVHRVCTPTRSSFMSGRYSWQNGAQMIFSPQTLQHLPFTNGPNTKILPQYLKQYNFMTYGFGKWHLGYAAYNMTPIERGFDYCYGYQASGGQDYYLHCNGVNSSFDLWDNNVAAWSGYDQYSTKLYDAKTSFYINDFRQKSVGNPDAAFFLYAAYQTVHDPLEQPPDVNISATKYEPCEHITNAERKIYCQKMVEVDDVIGHMIDMLKENQMWNDTVLIFTTDNGGFSYYTDPDHSGYSVNLPYRGGKGTSFEGGLHGNAFISGGNYDILPQELRGKNNTVLSHAIDWLPTIIEGILDVLISWEDKEFITGLSIWNSIIDPSYRLNRSTLYLDLLIDEFGDQQAIIHNEYKYINGTEQFTLFYPLPPQLPYGNQSSSNETIFLFNLQQDPFEQVNIALENPDVVQQLQGLLDDARVNMGYMEFQSGAVQPEGDPALHNNTWSPWIK